MGFFDFLKKSKDKDTVLESQDTKDEEQKEVVPTETEAQEVKDDPAETDVD